MEQSEERFYVKNIPPNATEDDLKSFFANIGDIHDVVLKNNYGFFSAKGSSRTLKKATFMFANKDWNGCKIKLEKSAKESFMTRLAKEREASNNLKPAELVNGNAGSHINSHKTATSNKKRKYSSSDDSDDEEYKKGVPKFRGTVGLYPVDKPVSTNNVKNDVMSKFSEFDSMWADNDDPPETSGQLSAILGSGKPKKAKKSSNQDQSETTTKKNEDGVEKIGKAGQKSAPVSKLEKKKRDDERRKQSLANKSKEKQKQQSLIKSALSSLDAPKGKKIVFGSDDEETHEKKKNLFDDADDEQESNIVIVKKEHFEGEKGRKLLKLQSLFNNDDRFKMDQRFLDDDDEENKKAFMKNRPNEMIRFDPTRQEVQEPEPKVKRKLVNEKNLPEVSQERFYQVSDTLTAAFNKESTGFSLLTAYGKRNENKPETEPDNVAGTKLKPLKKRNPLLEDSSDEEDGLNEEPEKSELKIWAPVVNAPSGPRDNFFFSRNDPLVTEAIQFMSKKNSDEAQAAAENYDTTRKQLRKIFKDQAMRRSKKNDMFKKKVGGMKKKVVKRNPFTTSSPGKVKRKNKR